MRGVSCPSDVGERTSPRGSDGYNLHTLAVSRDGSRFYFPQAVEQPDSDVIHVKMGWLSPR